MKRKVVFVSCAAIVLLFGYIVAMVLFNRESKVEVFNVADYSEYITEFPSDEILGPIENAKSAKEKAEEVWLEIYGERVKSKKPYTVSFDDKNQVWLVKGSLPKNYDGGVPYILIQKSDGKVLAVWHGK